MESLSVPVSRREQRKLDRRRAIVDAARDSFLRHGYAGTSMSSLLNTLGGSKATLWSYFRSKEDLFAAVIEDVSGSFRAELETVFGGEDAADPETVLIAFCRAFTRKITSPEALATWRLVVAESGRFPEVGRIFFQFSANATQVALATFISRAIAAGKLRDDNATHMADMLISLCVGRQTHLLWDGGQPRQDELDKDAARFARWFWQSFGCERDGSGSSTAA